MYNETLFNHAAAHNGLKRHLDQDDRSEKKKNREKYRRDEVNEKFNELADVMEMAEKFLLTGQVLLEHGKTSSSKCDHICRAISMIHSFVKENSFLKQQLELQTLKDARSQITNNSIDNQFQVYPFDNQIINIHQAPSIPSPIFFTHPNNIKLIEENNVVNSLSHNTCRQQLYVESNLTPEVIQNDSCPSSHIIDKSIAPITSEPTQIIATNECFTGGSNPEFYTVDSNCQKTKDQEEAFDLSNWENDFFPFLSLSMWDEAEIPAPTHAEVA